MSPLRRRRYSAADVKEFLTPERKEQVRKLIRGNEKSGNNSPHSRDHLPPLKPLQEEAQKEEEA